MLFLGINSILNVFMTCINFFKIIEFMNNEKYAIPEIDCYLDDVVLNRVVIKSVIKGIKTERNPYNSFLFYSFNLPLIF